MTAVSGDIQSASAESTAEYIKHRLRLAGCPRLPFTDEALLAVHHYSGGSPRLINTICDNALFEAFLARSQDISGELINQIGENLGLGKKEEALPSAATSAPSPRLPPTSGMNPSATRPSGKIDLAEIDRYLEGLGKL
jgi:hypothetical protein